MEPIRHPGVRGQVLSAIEALADLAYQIRVWIRHEPPHPGYYDEFDLTVHTLFDDTMVLPNPDSAVGEVLYPDEVEPLRALGKLLGPLIDETGDEPYLAHPRWPMVVEAAQAALAVMKGHEE
jgi:hypothetical protein